MATSISNISSLVNPNLASLAKEQLTSRVVTRAKQTILTQADEIKNRINEIKDRIINTNKEYDVLISNIQSDSTLNAEEKSIKINEIQQKRSDELNLLNEDINRFTTDLGNIVLDPLKKAKEERAKIKKQLSQSKKRIEGGFRKANLTRNKIVLKNAGKSIAPVLLNQLTNIAIRVISNTNRLQELVNKTNEVIAAADTKEKINQARVLRNNALVILNNQQTKVVNFQKVIQTIQRIVNILNIIVRIIQRILRLGSPFPIPLPVKISLQPVLQRILGILAQLNIVLSIIDPVLSDIIAEIERFKAELLQLGILIDIKVSNPTAALPISDIGGFLEDINLSAPPSFETYKGFKFAIKEETGPNAKVVAGNKRRYAVAIDTNNVEVLKSELSFTLDPNDLVETLKIIIDRENLIA